MAVHEVLFKVGASSKYVDGGIIEVRKPGIWIDAATIRDYLDNGTIPAGWANMPRPRRKYLKRFLLKQKKIVQTDYADLPQEYKDRFPEEVFLVIKADAQSLWTRIRTEGIDTTHGRLDLMHHGVAVMDLTSDDIEDITEPDWDDTADPLLPRVILNHRKWFIPYYDLAPASLVDRWRDPNDMVLVNRVVTPLTMADLTEIA